MQLMRMFSRLIIGLLAINANARTRMMEECTDRIEFFINMVVEIPELKREKTGRAPMGRRPEDVLKWEKILLPRFQEELIHTIIRRINNSKNLLIEKSEKMYATSSMILISLWYFLFVPRSDILIVTPMKKNVYIDDFLNLLHRNPEEIDKLKNIPVMNLLILMYKRLPIKLKPYSGMEFIVNKSNHYICHLRNNDNGNRIYVTSGHKEFSLNKLFADNENGVHRYFRAIFIDDMAFNHNIDDLWPQLKEYTDSIICISSANGKNNLFYELKEEGLTDLYTLHWILKSDTGKEWYNGKQKQHTPEYIEQFLNINYNVKDVLKRTIDPEKKSQKKKEKEDLKKEKTVQTSNITLTQEDKVVPPPDMIKKPEKMSDSDYKSFVELINWMNSNAKRPTDPVKPMEKDKQTKEQSALDKKENKKEEQKEEKKEKKEKKKPKISCLTGVTRPMHKNPKGTQPKEYKEILKDLIKADSKSVNLPVVKNNTKAQMIISTAKLENLIRTKGIIYNYCFYSCLDLLYDVYDKEHALNKLIIPTPKLKNKISTQKTSQIFSVEITEEDKKEAISELRKFEYNRKIDNYKMNAAREAKREAAIKDELQRVTKLGLNPKAERRRYIERGWRLGIDNADHDRDPIEPYQIREAQRP